MTEDISQEKQRLLAGRIEKVIKQVRSLQKKISEKKLFNVEKFEITEHSIGGRDVYLIRGGKNCWFEVDKRVLNKLFKGNLCDFKATNGSTVTKDEIFNFLDRYIGMAEYNIKYTESFIKES